MLLAGFAAAWLLGGCAKPPPAFESAIDPAVTPHAAVDRIMVFGAGVSEADRRAIEAAPQTAAGVAGIVTLSGGGRESESIEAVVALANRGGADAALRLALIGGDVVPIYMPPRFVPSVIDDRLVGDDGLFRRLDVPHLTEGRVEYRPVARFRAGFIDVASGREIWYTKGRSAAGRARHSRSCSGWQAAAIARLKADGLIWSPVRVRNIGSDSARRDTGDPICPLMTATTLDPDV